MNLRETILKEQSKANCIKIVNWIGNDPKRFDELVQLFLHDEYVVMQRVGWPLSEIVALYPALVKKYIGPLIKLLDKQGIHEAVKRNITRILQYIDIPKKYHGEVMNRCFDYIISPNEKPAVKAFSLTVLQHLSEQYPEIKQELKTVIEDRWEFETPAFHSRARKILSKFS